MLVEEQFQNCTNRTAKFLLFKLEEGGRNLTRGREHERRNLATVTLSSELMPNGIFSTLTAGGQNALRFANMLAHEPQLGPFQSRCRRRAPRVRSSSLHLRYKQTLGRLAHCAPRIIASVRCLL